MPQPRCFQVNPLDNVATMLDDATAERVTIIGGAKSTDVDARQAIKLGHKIALRAIRANEPVVKFGVSIGHASRNIAAGEWVHLHNLTSNFDERSQTLDIHTGAATDTKYE
jgi:altronate dehydratase small subunit